MAPTKKRSSRKIRIKIHAPNLCIKSFLPQPTRVWDLFWYVAQERQNIFFRRLRGDSVLTDDPIFQHYKFTNAYRASDRVSQYLIAKVLYDADAQYPLTHQEEEIFFRCLIFKTFNAIPTWELLQQQLGRPISWATYNYDEYERILREANDQGFSVYSAAYMHPSFGQGLPYKRKHQCHLKLIERMMEQEAPAYICAATSFEEVFRIIRQFTMIGDFLAYQYATDLNYSTLCNFDEMSFTKAGPGAENGISRCFSNWTDLIYEDVIHWAADVQEAEFKQRGMQFSNLWGRRLQLIDIQNLFCEVDKYARVAAPGIRGRLEGTNEAVRIKQKFKQHGALPAPFYPPKWGLNEVVQQELKIRFLHSRVPLLGLGLHVPQNQ